MGRGGQRTTRGSWRWVTSTRPIARSGWPLIAVGDRSDVADVAIEPMLKRIQNDLFDLGADLCLPRQADEKPGAVLRVAPSQVQAIEHAIDALNARLDPLRSFVLPGGTAAAAALHHARAVCRRAERAMVALAAIEGEEVGDAALAYVILVIRLRLNGEWRGQWSVWRNRVKRVLLIMSTP